MDARADRDGQLTPSSSPASASAPVDAYSRGFLDGIRAFQALLPLLHEGPNHDPAEFWRRLHDPDVLPVGR